MDSSEIKEELFSCDKTIKKKFQEKFHFEIDDFCVNYKKAFDLLVSFKRDPNNNRHIYIEMFLISAFNYLLFSMKLLVSGQLVPSGNLVRSFCETISVALLCSSDKINVFEHIINNPSKVSYQKMPDKLNNKENKKILGIDRMEYGLDKDVIKFYHKYSHGTLFANLSFYNITEDNSPCIGNFYGPGKEQMYKMEIDGRNRFCKMLISTIELIKNLQEKSIK